LTDEVLLRSDYAARPADSDPCNGLTRCKLEEFDESTSRQSPTVC
jgi:hypothetical protein